MKTLNIIWNKGKDWLNRHPLARAILASIFFAFPTAYIFMWLREFHDQPWTNLIKIPSDIKKLDSAAHWTFLFWVPVMMLELYRHHVKDFSRVQSECKSEIQAELKKFEHAQSEGKRYIQAELEKFNRKIEENIVFNVDLTKSYNKAHINDLTSKLNGAFPPAKSDDKPCPFHSACTRQADGTWRIKLKPNLAPPSTASIYAVDAGNPHKWWSESLLGYLAVQAEWRAQDCPPFHKRSVSRVFIWTPADLLSQLGIKLITLHRLLGFETYVVLQNDYEDLRSRIWKDSAFDPIRTYEGIDNHFALKEFVIWAGFETGAAIKNRGYRSFWSIRMGNHPKRDEDEDIDGESAAKQRTIKWRNFFDYELDAYLDFYMKLTENHREVGTEDDFPTNKMAWEINHKNRIFKVTATDGEQIEKVLCKIATLESHNNGHAGRTIVSPPACTTGIVGI